MLFEEAVRIEAVSKRYKLYSSPWQRIGALLRGKEPSHAEAIDALKDVSFSVQRGETLAIIGRNGSGKSTLLQVLCGILQPDGGKVVTNGRIAALLELGAGFSPEFTGRENIYMSAAVYGLSREQVDERLEDILAFAEIDDFIDRPVKTYSSGMYVRLAFALIAHLDADILVVDEALAVGDAYFTQKCVRFLREFKARGTLIFVSHDTHSVISLCDKALWLERGVVQMLGDAKTVSESYLASLHMETLPEQSAGVRAQGEFGTGLVKITECRLLNSSGEPLYALDGPGLVTLEVCCQALADIEEPILGFFVRDRLGQPLFGDNTLGRENGWRQMRGGQNHRLRFSFAIPLLATGDYTVGVAIGSGSQEQHVQHHWIYEAFSFKSQASPHLTGFFHLDDLGFSFSEE